MTDRKPVASDPQVTAAWRALAESPLRVTRARQEILRVLASEHGPFSAVEIFEKLDKGVCDLVTTYRTLTTLEEAGLARRCDFGDSCYRYEYNAGEHHHHHIVCRRCRKVETVDLCVADVLERVAKQRGYSDISHTLEIFGVCAECAPESTRKEPQG